MNSGSRNPNGRGVPAEDPGLVLVDCDTSIGRPAGGQWARNAEVTVAALVEELDRNGIAGAVAHHAVAKDYAPREGNAMLTTALAGQRRVLASWIVMPHHTGEMPPPEQLVTELEQAGVALARIQPATNPAANRYWLNTRVVGPLTDALASAGVPLAVDFSLFRRGELPWDELWTWLEHHPTLDVILTQTDGRNNRTLYPLLEAFPRLHVKTAGFNVHRGIEDFVVRFGAHRMIFGSGHPYRSMGSARFHLETAEIAPEARELIAAGNLLRLLPSWAPAIVDAHGHPGSTPATTPTGASA